MVAFSLYIIQSTICLTLFYLGYKALLSKETFFAFNRKVLLGGMLACFFLPFIPLKTSSTGIVQQPMIQLEKAITEMEKDSSLTPEILQTGTPGAGIAGQPAGKFLSPLSLCLGIFTLGGAVNLYLLLRSYIQLRQIIRRGKLIVKEGYRLVILSERITPFNYGPYIAMSDYDYRNNLDLLTAHELVHLHKHHSFDLLFMGIASLFHWFNPVVWLLKRELQDVHEYEADVEVLNKGVDAIKYQLLLVRKAAGPSSYALASSFNHRTLKKRISMMLKRKSNKWARLRLTLLAPLAAITLAAFANPGITRQLEQIIRSEDTVNHPPDTSKFTPGFFESELDKYLVRMQGNTSSPPNKKLIFLKGKTNQVSLFVNATDDVALDEQIIRKADVPATLPTLLAETLLNSPKNGKPLLIYMIIDEASHAEFVDKILDIIGTTFANNQETLGKKDQPPLLLLGDRKSFTGKLSGSHQVKVNIYDGAGNITTFEVDSAASIEGMQKQSKSISFDEKGNYYRINNI